jgi:hypothetical protein
MLANNVPTKAEVESGDPLTEKIRQSILGVENLRAENRRLTDQVKSLEGHNLRKRPANRRSALSSRDMCPLL